MASSRLCLSQCDESEKSSVTNKFQQKYWKTKQTLIRVTGKREDEHVVASDAELDAKLEVFHSVQRTCLELLKVIEQYQHKINFLSQEENELGRFLRSQGSQDRSRAGKMMQATGKALCLSSQQRLALRGPLTRLHQELETFRFRAVSDTWLTVNRMEQSRTDYRGALLWMKDVSQELDPDTHKQMEKFRKVQTQVRQTKTNFDKLKMDVCQKVDVLGASRCNLLSHILTNYQTTLLHYWEKTSHTMAAIHENFRTEIPATTKTKEKKKRKSDPEEEKNKSDEMLISVDGENSTAGDCVAVEQEKDELSLLSEILGSACVDEGGWSEMFGEEALTNKNPAEMPMLEEDSSIFLPSRLLDQNTSLTRPAVSETSSRDRWFDLFADLDPLSNPDAVGRRENDELLNA